MSEATPALCLSQGVTLESDLVLNSYLVFYQPGDFE